MEIKQKPLTALTIILTVIALIFTTVLFAGAISAEQGGVNSPYVSAYFDKNTVNIVNITISEKNWQDMRANPLDEEYHAASVTINGDVYDGIGIRTKGMTSLSQVASSDSDRYSFKIKADEYVNGQTFQGLSEFVLNNNIQDATSMKDYLSYDMMNEMGVPAPLYSFAAIYLNGEYWGLYLMVEAVEEDFAKRNFGANYGSLYKPESVGGGKNDGNGNGFGRGNMPAGIDDAALQQLAELPNDERNAFMQQFAGDKNGNREPFGPDKPAKLMNPGDQNGKFNPPGEFNEGNPDGLGDGFGNGGGTDLVYNGDDPENYKSIFDNAVFKGTKEAAKQRVITALKHLKEGTDLESYIEVDEVLRYFAAHTALVNLDSYTGGLKHNYYLYEEDGKLSMIPWDYNLAFGAFQTSASDAVNFPIDTPVSSNINLIERPMIGSLLAVDEYKNRYHEYMQWIAENYFGSSFAEKVDKIDKMISEYVKSDPTAFFTYEQYREAIAQLKIYGLLRGESIAGQVDGSIPSTWDGQKANTTSLVQTAGLNLSAMGSMGGGRIWQRV